MTDICSAPAESRPCGGGADIRRRSTRDGGDIAGREGSAACPPRKPGPAPGIYIWRGREYRGQDAVAASAGVSACMVSFHLNRHGNLDRLGVGSAWTPARRGTGGRRKGVSVCGRHWPSRTAMAADLGVSYSTVYDWLRNDRIDLILRRLMARDARVMAEAKRART